MVIRALYDLPLRKINFEFSLLKFFAKSFSIFGISRLNDVFRIRYSYKNDKNTTLYFDQLGMRNRGSRVPSPPCPRKARESRPICMFGRPPAESWKWENLPRARLCGIFSPPLPPRQCARHHFPATAKAPGFRDLARHSLLPFEKWWDFFFGFLGERKVAVFIFGC